MGKKSGAIVFTFALLLMVLMPVNAQAPSGPSNIPFQGETEQAQDVVQNLTVEERRNQYLREEWRKILERSQAGKVLLSISDFFKAFNPVFKLILGIEYTLSWLFFITLGIWLGVAFIIYDPIRGILQAKWWIALLIAIIISTLGAQAGVIPWVISLFSPLFTNQWAILTFLFAVFAVLVLYNYAMKALGKKIKEQMKRDKEKMRELKASTVEKMHDFEIKSNT